jgi:hypothetical protein
VTGLGVNDDNRAVCEQSFRIFHENAELRLTLNQHLRASMVDVRTRLTHFLNCSLPTICCELIDT